MSNARNVLSILQIGHFESTHIQTDKYRAHAFTWIHRCNLQFESKVNAIGQPRISVHM